MRTMKKALSLALVFALLISLAVTPAMALTVGGNTYQGVSLSFAIHNEVVSDFYESLSTAGSKSSYSAGEYVAVRVSIEGDVPGSYIRGYTVALEYDKAVLASPIPEGVDGDEVESWGTLSAASGATLLGGYDDANGTTTGAYMASRAMPLDGSTSNTSGDLCYAIFKVVNDNTSAADILNAVHMPEGFMRGTTWITSFFTYEDDGDIDVLNYEYKLGTVDLTETTVTSGAASVTVSGGTSEDTVLTPTAASVSGSDESGRHGGEDISESVKWTVELPAGTTSDDVDVNDAGKIVVSAKAKEATYTLKCSPSTEGSKKTYGDDKTIALTVVRSGQTQSSVRIVTVNDSNEFTELKATDTAPIISAGDSAKFAAIAYNQYDEPFTNSSNENVFGTIAFVTTGDGTDTAYSGSDFTEEHANGIYTISVDSDIAGTVSVYLKGALDGQTSVYREIQGVSLIVDWDTFVTVANSLTYGDSLSDAVTVNATGDDLYATVPSEPEKTYVGTISVVDDTEPNVSDGPVNITLRFTVNNDAAAQAAYGTYAGKSVTKTFTGIAVNKKKIPVPTISTEQQNLVFKNDAYTFAPVTTVGSEDYASYYTLTLNSAETLTGTNAGEYPVVAHLVSDANTEWDLETASTADQTLTYTIKKKPLDVAWTNTSLTFTNAGQVPTATIDSEDATETALALTVTPAAQEGAEAAQLVSGAAVNVGTYNATAAFTTAQDNYELKTEGTGANATTFTIGKASIESATITVTGTANYDGTKQEPAFTAAIELVSGTSTPLTSSDYDVEYKNAVDAGSTAQIVLTGKGNYEGEATQNFNINAKDLSSLVTFDTSTTYYYTGSQIKMSFTATDTIDGSEYTLLEHKDFEVEYSNNINVSGNTDEEKALVTVTGIGNYTGTATQRYVINGILLTNDNTSFTATDYTVNDDDTVTLKAATIKYVIKGEGGTVVNETDLYAGEDKDYTIGEVVYNADTSKATVTIHFINNYSGDVEYSFDTYKLGDVDGNKKVNATDALKTLKSSVGSETFNALQKLAADVDGNKKVNATDALNILKYSVGSLTAWPINRNNT